MEKKREANKRERERERERKGLLGEREKEGGLRLLR